MNDTAKYWFCAFGGAALAAIVAALMFQSVKVDKPKAPPKDVRWIGRLVAGDESQRVFAAPQIEIGLGSDGVLLWRAINFMPQPLLSMPQPEADK